MDNGPMGSFWGTLKCVGHLRNDLSRERIRFYDERQQKSLNGLSPIEYGAKAAQAILFYLPGSRSVWPSGTSFPPLMPLVYSIFS